MKRRSKLQTTLASEVVGQRSGLQTRRPPPAQMSMASMHARNKMKARRKVETGSSGHYRMQ